MMKTAALVGIIALVAILNGGMTSNGSSLEDPNANNWKRASTSNFEYGTLLPKEEIANKSVINNVDAVSFGVYNLKGVKVSSAYETKRWPIASITKLMTAVVARELMQNDLRVEIKEEYINLTEGIAGGFSPGEVFILRDLEKALLMLSSNVAGEAIAGIYGREKFIDTMNSFAFKIGMKDTLFVDPTGLSFKNQSTPEDLSRLALYMINNHSGILATTKSRLDRIYDFKSGKRRNVPNINEFAGRSDFLGGKTGTTPEAIGNLLSIFSKDNGKTGKIIIMLGTEHRYEETIKILEK